MRDEQAKVEAAYALVAKQYGEKLSGELANKPFDRLALDQLLDYVGRAGGGPIADVGCGPGTAGRYLADKGADVVCVDRSEAMLEVGRGLHPDLAFHQGDLRELPFEDGAWAGAVGFYAIVNMSLVELPAVFVDLARVVRPGGWLLLAFHVANLVPPKAPTPGQAQVQAAGPGATRGRARHGVLHVEDWWGHEVDVDFYFHDRHAVSHLLKQTGWFVRDALERKPYAEEVEYQSRRAYVFAQRRPDAADTPGAPVAGAAG